MPNHIFPSRHCSHHWGRVLLLIVLAMGLGAGQASEARPATAEHHPHHALPYGHPPLPADEHVSWLLWNGPSNKALESATMTPIAGYFAIAGAIAFTLTGIVLTITARTDRRQRRLMATRNQQLQAFFEARAAQLQDAEQQESEETHR